MEVQFRTELMHHIHAGFPGLWIETTEPDVGTEGNHQHLQRPGLVVR